MPTVHWSLGYFKERGYGIKAYCEQPGPEPMCRHSAPVDIDKAIAVFGADFVIPHDRPRFLRSLKCAHCGSRQIGIQIVQPSGHERPSGHPPQGLEAGARR